MTNEGSTKIINIDHDPEAGVLVIERDHVYKLYSENALSSTVSI